MARGATKTKSEVKAAVGAWGEREAGILDVARRLYDARGYERVSMADVAQAAGLAEGTLYNYFRDKTDLVLRVGLVALDQNLAEAQTIAETATSLRGGLRDLIACQLRWMIAAPEMYRIWLREVKGAESYGRSRARDDLRRFSNQFNAFLDRWGAGDAAGAPFNHAMMRDMLYGGIEQIGWTAVVQGKSQKLDLECAAAALADAYIAAFSVSSAGSQVVAMKRQPATPAKVTRRQKP
jgi:TetR/AcrR family transcriptional regulator, fatty acid metabolism regulator protein